MTPMFFVNAQFIQLVMSPYGWFGWFMVFNATFQLYRGGQFFWWRKPEYP
jgi:hypothetical protein